MNVNVSILIESECLTMKGIAGGGVAAQDMRPLPPMPPSDDNKYVFNLLKLD